MMNDSDLEILGISPTERIRVREKTKPKKTVCKAKDNSKSNPLRHRQEREIADSISQPRDLRVNCKAMKKSTQEKLKETEVFHHRTTTATKTSLSRKKRRRTCAERNNKKAKNEKQQKDHSLMNVSAYSSAHPLITQSRITMGIYNKAKTSSKISRDLKVLDPSRLAVKDDLHHGMDVADANLPPPPRATPMILDDIRQSVAINPDLTPKVHTVRSTSTHQISSSHPDQGISTTGHRESIADTVYPRLSDGGLDTSPELSPVSEAAELLHRTFRLKSIFPGRDYYQEVKDGLVQKLQKQKQSFALQTPRKSRAPSKHHSSVRKNLSKDFAQQSGNTEPILKSIDRSLQQGDVVKRTDLHPKDEPPNPSAPGPSGSWSNAPNTAPHTAPMATGVNAFEECTLKLQHQPPDDILVEGFFPKVETQVLSEEYTGDILDYIHLSCSSKDSLTYPDPYYVEAGIPPPTLIYPPHLHDHTLSRSNRGHGAPPMGGGDRVKGMVKGRFKAYSSDSDESPPIGILYPLPPPFPPSETPSPPLMSRHRMY